jgi:hypothetical protein
MDIRSGIDVYEGSAGVDRKVEFIEDVEGLVDAVGIELEPFCGRLSPQAKSRVQRGTSNLILS